MRLNDSFFETNYNELRCWFFFFFISFRILSTLAVYNNIRLNVYRLLCVIYYYYYCIYYCCTGRVYDYTNTVRTYLIIIMTTINFLRRKYLHTTSYKRNDTRIVIFCTGPYRLLYCANIIGTTDVNPVTLCTLYNTFTFFHS